MEPNRREFIKQCAFQKFCNTVLHNEACDAHKELHRHNMSRLQLPMQILFGMPEDRRKCIPSMVTIMEISVYPETVSYTHLDVYKRQTFKWDCSSPLRDRNCMENINF